MSAARFWRRLRGASHRGVDMAVPSVFLGTSYGGYAVLPESLSADAVVYSFGLGEDVSFDLELIARFGCTVHGFDPTPRAITWLESQALPSKLVIHPYGLADFDGVARFAPPADAAHVSHTMLGSPDSASIDQPVKRLPTIMGVLGHARVDLLKMDIEGAEYAVVRDLVSCGVRPRQLLVEFHHGRGGITPEHTDEALEALRGAGYQVFHARETGREFSLCAAALART